MGRLDSNKTITAKEKYSPIEHFVIDEYARYIGPVAFAIYIVLRRYRNAINELCFPSEDQIAEKLNIDKRTVIRHIKILAKSRFISIYKRQRKGGKWLNNSYVLTSPDYWINISDDFNQVTDKPPPSDKNV